MIPFYRKEFPYPTIRIEINITTIPSTIVEIVFLETPFHSLMITLWTFLCLLVLADIDGCMGGRISLGSRLLASENQTWNSDNGTFAFGFAAADSRNDQFRLGIWFAKLPGDRVLVWSAYM